MYNKIIIDHKYGRYILLVVGRDSCDSVYVYQGFSLDFQNRLWQVPMTEHQIREKIKEGEIVQQPREPSVLVYYPTV